ncbi:F-box protein At1g67340-like [Rhodamnia argentea]|uniref:F-box protein At1g67340-like n=1 Tax=Rhodamnia argentea TaxID=178133 RepID=A0ABM3GS21_9MYRT|nr:F-box protein At1g67340-like [Rhodamnia argentea]
MRTRRGMCYPKSDLCSGKKRSATARAASAVKRRRRDSVPSGEDAASFRRKRRASYPRAGGGRDFFDALPDDLVLSVLCKVAASASAPPDLVNVLLTCKRFKALGLHSMVLSKASSNAFTVRAHRWCDSAHRFLKLCADAGNVEASYTLGMIRFYCLQSRGSGASLMAKAAIGSHAPALYSLAVIQFNGSGGSKNDKDLRAGVALCARAAFLGHVDAMRELGHCLQDGYGVRQNVAEGRRFLVQANARELATVLSSPSAVAAAAAASLLSTRAWLAWNSPHAQPPHQHQLQQQNHQHHPLRHVVAGTGCPLLSDFGCNVPAPEAHPANRFMAEWFAARGGSAGPGLRQCSHVGCGRPETRKHEFRRCSVCGAVNYCSRACQALDWKLRHKAECTPVERWVDEDVDGDGEGEGEGDGGEHDGVGGPNGDVMEES